MKATIELKDMFGQVLSVGDRVAFASYKNLGLTVGTVKKLGTKRAYVFAKDGDPGVITPWIKDGWEEAFATKELIKLTGV